MNTSQKELTPVIYNSAAVKILYFKIITDNFEAVRMHWHDRMELLRIEEGTALIDLGSAQRQVEADTLVIIPPNQPHRVVCLQAPLRYHVIMFDVRSFYNQTDICQKYLPSIFDGCTKFETCTSHPEVLQCADIIISHSADDWNAFFVTSQIYQLLYLFHKYCLLEISAVNVTDETIREIIQYIEKNYTEDLSTDLLSTKFGYAKSYFCRKFKECTGLTPMTYLNIFRMETAYRMLKTGGQEISEVAALCGFHDSNYFTRCFRRHFGHPPTYYLPFHAEQASS